MLERQRIEPPPHRRRLNTLVQSLAICLGENPEVPERKTWLLVGDCALVEGKEERSWVSGCPPSREVLLGSLIGAMAQ